MPSIRRTIRAQLAGYADVLNELVADVTAIVAGDKPYNSLRGRSATTKIVADLAALRVPMAASVIDVAAMRIPIAASVVDVAAMRTQIAALVVDAAAMKLRGNVARSNPAIANGTTAGKIKTANAIYFAIKGALYSKAATDDLWDLSALIDTDATHYRAYWLYLDSVGTATAVAGTDALTSEAIAIAALPAIDPTKSVIGVYIAGPSTDFNAVGGLAGQGAYYNGLPADYTATAAAPAALTAAAPDALTAAAPAAMTASASAIGITDGTTAGKLKTQADTQFTIAGTHYTKVPTDDLWDLSAEIDTIAAKYRAYVLYLNSSGVASFDKTTTDATSSDLALAGLPTLSTTKAVIGVYVAGPSTDFNGAAGLASFGTIANGVTGAPGAVITAETITLVSP